MINKNRDYSKLNLEALDEFAGAADKTQADLKTEELHLLNQPRVVISGMLDRKTVDYKISSSHIQKRFLVKAEKLCQGNKWAILNYVIKRGLDAIEKEKKMIIIQASEI